MNTLFMIMTFSWLLTCTAADLWKTWNVRTTHCQVSWNCIIFPNVATCFFWVLHVTTLCAYQIHFLNCQHVHYVDAEWVALLLKINLYIYLLESISMICAQNLITLIDSLKAKQHMLPRRLLQNSTITLSPPPRTSYIHPLTIQILTSL